LHVRRFSFPTIANDALNSTWPCGFTIDDTFYGVMDYDIQFGKYANRISQLGGHISFFQLSIFFIFFIFLHVPKAINHVISSFSDVL
jgi:hypothetical protein